MRSAWLIRRACRPHACRPSRPRARPCGVSAATRVDDDDVDGARAHERVGDLERLLAGVGLRDQQVLDLDAELLGVARVERVLGVDEGADAALLLGLGDDVQRERRLARAIPARRSRRRGRAAGRRCRARCRGRASRSEIASMSIERSLAPRRMIEPLPNCLSICASACASACALCLSMLPPSTTRNSGFDPWLIGIYPMACVRGQQNLLRCNSYVHVLFSCVDIRSAMVCGRLRPLNPVLAFDL